MQIASSVSASASIYPIASTSATTSTTTKKPEDFLTDADVKMIEYVSGTTSLDAAEQDPNAKILAVSLGTKRENGSVQGDVSKNYFYSQLTSSDAKMIESMTGTTNIIDAMNSKNSVDVQGLAFEIALDREQGSLTGTITTDYLNNLVAFDTNQLTKYGGAGITVPLDLLNQALAYTKSNVQTTDTTAGTSSTYSATA